MSNRGSWARDGSRWIAAGIQWLGAVASVLAVLAIAGPRASAGASADAQASVQANAARFEEARPRVVAWLSRGTAAVGEEVLMTIEVIGPVSVDVSLDDPQPVRGLLFRAASGPVSAIRTDTSASGAISRNYIATFTVPIRVLSGGRHEISPPAVIGPDESVWTHAPLLLDVRGLSADVERRDPVLEVRGPAAPFFAGERVPITVRVEVDDAACPMEARTFTFPWWDHVVALDPAGPASADAKWATVERADYRVPLSAGPLEPGGRRVFSGSFDVVPVRPGTLSLGGSQFTAVAAGTWSSPARSGAATVSATSSEDSIVVIPLPLSGRPIGFVDLVGDFDVTASIDRDVLTVGDEFTLTVDVRERGAATHLAFAQIVHPPQWPGFRPLDEPRYETAAGRCQVRFVFALEGVVTEVPALDVSWFLPAAGKYQTTTSGPFPLTVTARPDAGPDRDPEGDTPLAGALEMARRYGWIGALLITIGFAWWRVRRPWRSAARGLSLEVDPSPDDASRTGATESGNEAGTGNERVPDRQQARARFDEARGAAKTVDADALSASRALARYIADRCGASPASCFGAEAAARLGDLGVPAEVTDRAVRHFLTAESRAFGGAADGRSAGAADLQGWDDATGIVASIDAAIG